MIVNIVDEDVKEEVRRVMKAEMMAHLREEVDKAIPEIVSARLKGEYERAVEKRVGSTLTDHMEIATTIFLQKELDRHESFIRETFNVAIEKTLSNINFDNYFMKILGSNINALVDARIKEQLKNSFRLEIKEST